MPTISKTGGTKISVRAGGSKRKIGPPMIPDHSILSPQAPRSATVKRPTLFELDTDLGNIDSIGIKRPTLQKVRVE